MLAIIQAYEYQEKLALQAQALQAHLSTLKINKRREYLRQASVLGGEQSRKRSEEYALHMFKVIKSLNGNIKLLVKLLKENDHKTIHGSDFSDSSLYKLIRKINTLKGRTIWLEK
jgi:hypothetical protein